MTIIERIRLLEFPRKEYVVIGSGLLDALGLRASRDIDLVVGDQLFQTVRISGRYHLSEKHGEEVLERDDVEIWRSWGAGDELRFEALFAGGVTIDGIRFCHPSVIMRRKQQRGGAKDMRDIELLQRYMREHPTIF
ncbi:MAG: hypothetical protein WAS27_03650 [Candidatus Saccharimonadales bacterium]